MGRRQKIIPPIDGTLEEITKAVLSPNIHFIQSHKLQSQKLQSQKQKASPAPEKTKLVIPKKPPQTTRNKKTQ